MQLSQPQTDDATHWLLHAINAPIDQDQRLAWMQWLRQQLEHPIATPQQHELLCQLSHQLCDWAALVYLLQDASTLADRRMRLHASWQLADCEHAFEQLRQLYWHYPRAQMQPWPYAEELCLQSPEGLQLRPLGIDDLSAFCWQYSGDIAERCNLPKFDSDEHWLHWLAEASNDPAQQPFAVIHPEWGLIGSVSLEVHGDSGFFYYWLGADFQQHGFGPAAVMTVLSWAEQTLGLRHCFAKVYDHNRPSLRAMQRMGFVPLSCSLAAPHDDERLFYLGAAYQQPWLFDRLQRLFIDMNCDYQLVPWADAFIRPVA